jgi:murein L,D-transpeptidase YcbB/YkuD
MFGVPTFRTHIFVMNATRLTALAAGVFALSQPLLAQTTIPGSVAPVPGLAAPAPAPAAPAAPATTPAVPAAPAAAAPAPSTSEQTAIGAPAPAAQPQVRAVRKKRAAPPPAPLETSLPDTPEPSFTADTFYATAKASERYHAIAQAGGWPTVTALKPGAKGKAVAALRKRLAIEGDLAESKAAGESFDSDLKEAVMRFQDRNGLRKTGVVGGGTLRALNISAAARFKQLVSSAQRMAGYMFSFGDRYVVVNIPSASVEAVQGGVVVRRYVAVVGDVEHPSPETVAKIQAINLNPTWTVPTSIIKNEIIPKMQKDPGYLSRANIRVLTGSGKEVHPGAINWGTEQATNYILRQDSGRGNALGDIRIAMPNKDAVYMHDTPSKSFFGRDYRFLSHGCVRVQGVYDLAAWLAEPVKGNWDKKAISSKIATGAREDIKLPAAVPVAWVYLTGWASRDGVVHFRPDVYGLDTVGPGDAAQSDRPKPMASR